MNKIKKKEETKSSEDYVIGDVRLLGLAEKRNTGVGLGRQNVDEGVGVAVQGDGGGGLEMLSINSTENPDVVIGSRGGPDDAVVLIHHLHELTDHQRHRLDPLHLLLGAEELPLQILLLVFHVLLLDVDELQLALQGFQAAVEVVLVGGLGLLAGFGVRSCGGERSGWLRHHR